MPRIEKAEALARVEAERQRLPASFDGCVMCALARGFPADTEQLAESPRAVVVLDRFAARRGHVLVVLRRHVESIAALSWDEYAEVQKLAWEATRALERVLAPRRTFVAALGAATARVNSFPHHHVHVIPIEAGDTQDRPAQVLTWELGVYVYEEGEAKALGETLRASWSALE
ncbi:MAG TPA: HIT family protein [Polyangium sp.]|nr:HIT family protein [Polyangium sp.]